MNELKIFEDKKVRSLWSEEESQWYFSVVDVCNVLAETDSQRPGTYWSVLKTRLIKEGSELPTFCRRLKMIASDGKLRNSDALNTEEILRLVQSIPSKKSVSLSSTLETI